NLHDIEILTGWLNSTQALLLGALAVVGVRRIYKDAAWGREFRLALWLAFGLALFNAITHPTFERYFVFLVPFVSILAVAGLFTIGSRRTAGAGALFFGFRVH